MSHRMFSLTLRFPLLVLALLFAVIWGIAGYINLLLKHDLERVFSTQQFSAVSRIAASIDQETVFVCAHSTKWPKSSVKAHSSTDQSG